MTCPDPTSPVNGYIEVSQYSGQYEYGSVATYHCNPGYTLDRSALTRAVCGEGGVWEADTREEEGVVVSHQGTTTAPAPRCLPLSCSSPPRVEHALMDLLNQTAGLGSLLVYQCETGYRDLSYPGGVSVSQCQTDTTWSPVNITCVFDPAAVASNILEYERGEDGREGWTLDIGTVVTIVSISVAIILSLMIILVVLKQRRMREKLARSRQFSKMPAGGVKVLPDYLFSPTPAESQCQERPLSSISDKERDPEERGASPGDEESKFPAAPDVTIITRQERETCDTNTRESKERQTVASTEEDPDKEQIYESVKPLETLRRRERSQERGLYAKVSKFNSTDNGPNLNSDFVSIYELTRVEGRKEAPSQLNSNINTSEIVGDASEALEAEDSSDLQAETKTKSNFTFALDFSAKREINKVSFASFDPDNDEDILDVTNDERFDDSNGDDHTSLENLNCYSNKTSNAQSLYKNKIGNTPVQSEPIPKMQMNLFIQKDGKQIGSKKWPKVETPFCRQNRAAEVVGFNNCK